MFDYKIFFSQNILEDSSYTEIIWGFLIQKQRTLATNISVEYIAGVSGGWHCFHLMGAESQGEISHEERAQTQSDEEGHREVSILLKVV